MDGVLLFFFFLDLIEQGSAAHHWGAVKIFSPHVFSHYTQQMFVVIFCTAGIDGTLARWIQITATSTQTVTDGGRPPGSESDSGHPSPPPCRADVLQSPNAERWAGRPAGPWLNRRPPLTGASLTLTPPPPSSGLIKRRAGGASSVSPQKARRRFRRR